MTLTITPLSERFGAEVSGVDISRPLDADTQARIRAVQDQWGVTVWRQTGLTDQSHVAFSRLFGQVELAPVHKGKPPRFAEPELFDASNVDAAGNIVDNPLRRYAPVSLSRRTVKSAQASTAPHPPS